MGDPAGIGPEIVARCLADPDLSSAARLVVYGAGGPLTLAADRCGLRTNWLRCDAAKATDRHPEDSPLVLDDSRFGDLIDLPAQPTATTGHASKAWVEAATEDAMRSAGDPRRLDAIVTAPISKQAWHRASYKWPGHTELLAHRARSKRVCMVFESPQLRVALATIHQPLMTIRDTLTIGRAFDPIDLGAQACQQLGIDQPRIAVCGLNPHAGEGGVLGHEEASIITPAIDMARSAGIAASGPYPADTIFRRAIGGEFDLVVAMYHDQGLIPLKLLGQSQAVNWTFGLPFIRTSPDHGTAFDIAGTGQADPSSLKAAIELAVRLARTQALTAHA